MMEKKINQGRLSVMNRIRMSDDSSMGKKT
jgi:hypothetical protein